MNEILVNFKLFRQVVSVHISHNHHWKESYSCVRGFWLLRGLLVHLCICGLFASVLIMRNKTTHTCNLHIFLEKCIYIYKTPHLAWVDVIFLGDFSCLSWASIICNQAEILICWSMTLLSTLARGIDHLWSWARFMAAQILAIISAN